MKPKDGKPSASEFGQMIAFLAKHGINPADVRKRLGSSPNNRTRAEITQALKEWLKAGVI